MKRLSLLSFFILAMLKAYALPIGNPQEPALLSQGAFCDPCFDWMSFRLGFYGDYVFNRHLRSASEEAKGEIEKTEKFTNAAYFALNVWNRGDLFATIGVTNFWLLTRSNIGIIGPSVGFSDGGVTIKTRAHFSWSVGARAIVWECRCWTLGVEGEYFQTNPHVTRFSFNDNFSDYPANAPFHYREGQIGAALSYDFGYVIPYVGVKWSIVKVKCHHISPFTFAPPSIVLVETHDLENSKSFGYAVGLTLVECEFMDFTFEGRFADEKALYINAQMRF